MPLYRVRLEATDDDHARIEQILAEHPAGTPGRVERHFRVSELEADTPEAAQRVLERRELKKVLYAMPDSVLAWGEQENWRGVDLNQLLAHAQEAPYAVVSVEEV